MNRKSKRWGIILGIFCLLILVLPLALGACAAKPSGPITLTVTSALPAGASASTPVKFFGDKVTERTNGRITFDYKWGGALSKAGEELDAVSTGLADMGVPANIYYKTRLPLMNISFAVPFSPDDPKMMVDIARELYKKFPAMEDEFKNNNQVSLFYMPLRSYQMVSKTPIDKPEDMKGLRIGLAAGKYLAQCFQGYGASIVDLPATEAFQALQTGVIDAEILTWEYHSIFKTQEIAKHAIEIDFGGHYVWALTINKKVWDSLSSSDKKLMQEVALEAEAFGAEETTKRWQTAIDAFNKTGVTWHEISFTDKQRWSQTIPNLPQQWADEMEANKLPGRDIMKAYIQLAKDKGYTWPRAWEIK